MNGECSQHFGITLLQPTRKLGLGNEPPSPDPAAPPSSRPLALTVETGIKETDAASPKATCFGKNHFEQC